MSEERLCKTCRWWDAKDERNLPTDWGKCRRFPPTADKKWDWEPRTGDDDWCGEWSRKEVPAPVRLKPTIVEW